MGYYIAVFLIIAFGVILTLLKQRKKVRLPVIEEYRDPLDGSILAKDESERLVVHIRTTQRTKKVWANKQNAQRYEQEGPTAFPYLTQEQKALNHYYLVPTDARGIDLGVGADIWYKELSSNNAQITWEAKSK